MCANVCVCTCVCQMSILVLSDSVQIGGYFFGVRSNLSYTCCGCGWPDHASFKCEFLNVADIISCVCHMFIDEKNTYQDSIEVFSTLILFSYSGDFF